MNNHLAARPRHSLLLTLCLPGLLAGQPVIETVFFDVPANLVTQPIPAPTPQLLAVPGYPNDPARLTLIGRLYRPDPNLFGAGPHPVVVFFHGAGGMWSNDVIPNPITANNAPASQFRDWGNLLVGLGYAALFVDSFNPRGLPDDFEGKRPSYQPADDDHRCSPNYERPKDVVAALEFLDTLPDIDLERCALIGFSHGAQTAMNAVLDVSVDLGNYQVDYLDLVNNVEKSVKKNVPSPVRLPNHLPFPKFCAFYYGGGSHWGYHGSASSTAAGRYMVDRRTTAVLFHGTGDSLLDVSDPNADPKTGNLYPIKQVLASAAQAAAVGVPNPVARHYLFHKSAFHGSPVGHSFDLGTVTIAAPLDQDTAAESANQKARRLAREEVLKWLQFKLQPAPAVTLTLDANPASQILGWTGHPRLFFRAFSSENLLDWTPLHDGGPGTGAPQQIGGVIPAGGKIFYRLERQPVPPPVDALVNAGFFLGLEDFSL